MIFHPIQNNTGYLNWCGPAALSSLTGTDTSAYRTYQYGIGAMKLEKLVLELRNHGRVTGGYIWDIGRPLYRALPLHHRGVAVVERHRTAHAIAFHGKLIQDSVRPTPHWVLDSYFAKWRTTWLFLLEKPPGTC